MTRGLDEISRTVLGHTEARSELRLLKDSTATNRGAVACANLCHRPDMQDMHYTMNLLNEVMRPLDESKETLIKWLDAKWAAVTAHDAAMAADDDRLRDSLIIQAVLKGVPSPGRYSTIKTIVTSTLDLHRCGAAAVFAELRHHAGLDGGTESPAPPIAPPATIHGAGAFFTGPTAGKEKSRGKFRKSPFFGNCTPCGEKHMTSQCTASDSAMVAFQRTKIKTLKLKYPGDAKAESRPTIGAVMATLPEEPIDDDAESSSDDLTPEEEENILSGVEPPTLQTAFISACRAAQGVLGQAWVMDSACAPENVTAHQSDFESFRHEYNRGELGRVSTPIEGSGMVRIREWCA
eukprot:jgi/Tetstr1/453153/TSEL_040173.t1